MRLTKVVCIVLITLLAHSELSSAFATAPFIENFASSVANWADGSGADLATFVGSGGPDGSGYVSTTSTAFNVADGSGVVLFRGQDEFNSSGHAFEGDWLTGGINHFSAYVWHNAPVSLPFFVRFATASNFPGTNAVDVTPVPPNTWTQLNFDIVPSQINVSLFPEGPPSVFDATFSSVGHIQIGYEAPAGFGADPNTYSFGLDQVSISTPEPAGCVLALGFAAIGFIRRRSRVG